ncbi:MAG: hypothetical protein ACK4UJ_02160 [Leptonema sp. (in: bacteria)]
MDYKKIKIFLIMVFLTVSYCKKEKKEETKLIEVCQKVVECDASLKQFGDVQKHCQNLLSEIEKKDSHTFLSIRECIQTANCENLSLLKCMEPYIKNLQLKKLDN